jgi:hypothetical protein
MSFPRARRGGLGALVCLSRLRPTVVPTTTARGAAFRFDAACVGKVGTLVGCQIPALAIKATGRGSYFRNRLTAHGFPRGHCMRAKSTHGFKTGDMVRADASKGEKVGTYIGRVAVRASGSFNVQRPTGVVQVIDIRYCTILHRADGYKYHQ